MTATATSETASVSLLERLRHHAFDVLLEARHNGHGPQTAIDLGAGFPFASRLQRETRRRRIRDVIEGRMAHPLEGEFHGLRQMGHQVCANGCGYWIARDDAEWHEFLESERRGAKFKFVRLAQTATAARERTTGQGRLL